MPWSICELEIGSDCNVKALWKVLVYESISSVAYFNHMHRVLDLCSHENMQRKYQWAVEDEAVNNEDCTNNTNMPLLLWCRPLFCCRESKSINPRINAMPAGI